MKFKRLRIKNYRGVQESQVEFADTGITLIQGPNEVGKTSLAESVHMLFQFKASSSQKDVKSIKPVHRDAGTEIELEAESGEYHFVYRKQFHKAKSTELRVLAPAPRNYTDDEAHEQANRILADTLDKPLWDALIIRQGDMISQPDLRGKAALMEALDSAAGGEGSDRRAEGIFARVEAEYFTYHQKHGREGSDITAARRKVEELHARATECKTLLDELEQKSDRATFLKSRQATLRQEGVAKRDNLARERERLAEVEALERTVADARLTLKTAEANLAAQANEQKERERLRADVTAAAEETVTIDAELAEIEPLYQDAARRVAEAAENVAQAEAGVKRAEAATALARNDVTHHSDALHLGALRERMERIQSAREKMRAAEQILSENRVTSTLFSKMQKADREVATLEARLDAEAPRVVVRGLADSQLSVAGETAALREDEERAFTVSGFLSFAIPGHAVVEVTGGGSLEGLSAELAARRREFASLCEKAGVADCARAAEALEAARRAEAARDECRDVEKDVLGDMTFDALSQRVTELEAAVAGYGQTTQPNLDEARAALARAEAELKEKKAEARRVADTLEACRREYAKGEEKRQAALVSRRLSAKRREQAEVLLRAARERMPDDELAGKTAQAEEAVRQAQRAVDDGEARLRDCNPDRVRAMAGAAEGAVRSLEKQVHEVERELSALEAELAVRGEEGLFEEWQGAVVAGEEWERRLAMLVSRAEAAALLYEVMGAERDRARRAYLKPLRDKIEELGRVVWNPSFQVEMDEQNLSIVSRTLDGVTVPFLSLSGGAREQLSLIFRAACAILVSRHAGMPLILDDALGYTDTERLRLMGAVLARAAEECQVIIFTCVPERYSMVGDARVVCL